MGGFPVKGVGRGRAFGAGLSGLNSENKGFAMPEEQETRGAVLGAFIMKNYLYAYAQANEMAYFIGSDRVTEYYDTDRLLFGESGNVMSFSTAVFCAIRANVPAGLVTGNVKSTVIERAGFTICV
jgi:hypothetical protein